MNGYRRGFTLLELLIAMSLIGLLLGLLYGGFRLGVDSWDKGQTRAERLDEVRLAQDFLRRQLRQSVTVFRNSSDLGGRELYFSGEPERVGWVAPMLQYLDLGGLYYLELDRVGDPDNGQLRLRWHPYSPDDEDDVIDSDEAEQTILLDGVGGLTIDYFGPGELFDDPPEWRQRWDNPQLRPSLVRLQLELDDLDWPPLTVAVLN